MRSRRAIALLVACFAAVACAAHAQEPWRWAGVSRVVAIGDVHGAYARLVALLRETGVVGPDLSWTGGESHLVSVGDLLDRGPDARRVLELVMRLQREAEAAGGRFHVVLGNHEVMNLFGDLRYVPPAEYAAFAPEETAALRATAYAAFAAERPGSAAADTRALFDRTYPPGYFARRAAFGARGRYGAWLASLPAIVVINDTAYVHGGLPPIVAAEGLELNAKVQASLVGFLELRERLAAAGLEPGLPERSDVETARALVARASRETADELAALVAYADAPELGGDGPLWYRGAVFCKPLLEEPTLDAALERLNARRVVVGHTPTGDRRVRASYAGKLIALDTGMLGEYFGGRAAALVLEGDEAYVQYADPAERSAVDMSGAALAYGRSEAALREALERGAVVSVERGDGAGRWLVTLRHENDVIEAAFEPRRADRAADFELAAAALDDLLGAALVAPTVPRTVDGTEGALQLRYPDAVTEAERAARGLAFSGWCAIDPQLETMFAFDLLTANRGRDSTNVAFINDLTDLVVTDQTGGFGLETLRPGAAATRLNIPEPLVGALRSLDEASLERALGRWLGAAERRALLGRRDELVRERRRPSP